MATESIAAGAFLPYLADDRATAASNHDAVTLGSDQEDKISNMPYSLQEGATADMMHSRAEACEEVAGELESAADEIMDLNDLEDPPAAAIIQTSARDILDNIGWNFEP